MKFKIIEVGTDQPCKCPSCKTTLKEIYRVHRGLINSIEFFICPYCGVLLPVNASNYL